MWRRGLPRYGHVRRTPVREFGLLPYTDRNPSRDTFERLFAALGTDYVRQCVVEHGKRIMDVMNEKQIAIDGKKECGTAPGQKGRKGIIFCTHG